MTTSRSDYLGLDYIDSFSGSEDSNSATNSLWSSIIGATSSITVSGATNRASLNETKTNSLERELTVNAKNTPIPVTYGWSKIGPLMCFFNTKKIYIHMCLVWGYKTQAVYQMFLDETDVNSYNLGANNGQCYFEHFEGDQTTIPSKLTDAFPSYIDTLNGYCYTYIRISSNFEIKDIPGITAWVRGVRVYDPRTGLTQWSDNPSLCLADFLTNTIYGAGISSSFIDWDSVAEAANWNDESINGKRRAQIWLALQKAAPVSTWVKTLRQYAGVYLSNRGGKIAFVPDDAVDESSIITLTENDVAGNWAINTLQEKQRPTYVRVIHSDSATYEERQVEQEIEGAPRRESEYTFTGFPHKQQALTRAYQILNESLLCPRTISLSMPSKAFKHTVGDVIRFQPKGVNLGTFRILNITSDSRENFTVEGRQYDADMYQVQLADDDDVDVPDVVNPNKPTPPTDLALEEELYQHGDGYWRSRIKATWSAPEDFPFVRGYFLRFVGADGQLVFNGFVNDTEYRSPSITQQTYTVRVWTISTTDSTSAQDASATIEVQGKLLPPQAPHTWRRIEGAGGTVILDWEAEEYYNDPQTYTVKRIPADYTDISWDSPYAEIVKKDYQPTGLTDNPPLLGLSSRSFYYLVKSRDSFGNFSEGYLQGYCNVTKNPTFQFVDENTWTHRLDYSDFTFSPDLLIYYIESDGGTNTRGWYAEPDTTQSWLDWFGDATSLSESANANIEITRLRDIAGPEIYLESTTWDIGLSIGGEFVTTNITTYKYNSPNVDEITALSVGGEIWTEYSGFNIAGSGRYALIKIADAEDGTNIRGGWFVRLNVPKMEIFEEERTERGTATTNAYGTGIITFSNDYIEILAISLTAIYDGAETNISCWPSEYDTDGMTVKTFSDGTAVSCDVLWEVTGL